MIFNKLVLLALVMLAGSLCDRADAHGAQGLASIASLWGKAVATYLGSGIIASRDDGMGTLCDHIDYPPAFGGVPAFNLSEAAFRASNLPFQPKDMYVQHTLDYEPFLPLYKAVVQYAQSLNVTLTTRGDAHITVITPPEYGVLEPFVSMEEINAIVEPVIQDANFCIVCLGKDTHPINGSLNTVFNVVVRSPDLAALRKQIFTRFVEAGGDGSRFSPVNIFAPHITLGYTYSNPAFNATDLYLENGTFKWDNSCLAGINLVPEEPEEGGGWKNPSDSRPDTAR